MRVLFSTTAGAGHLGPLVPFIRGCAAAGHDVALAAPESFAPAVQRAGVAHLPFPDAPAGELEAIFARLPELPMEEANAVVVREVFAGADLRAALPGMADIVTDWRPDVVVREMSELASHVIAERRGIPQVQVAIGTAGLDEFATVHSDEPLRAHGLAGGSDGLRELPVLSLVPSCLDETRNGGPVHRFRYEAPPGGDEPLPAWGDASLPLVYVSFGTVAGTIGMFPGLYRAVVDALADEPVRVLVTVGESADPALLGPVPGNARVEPYRPQAAVMPDAAALVGHGGFGTTLTGLAYGVPMVVVPLFALDQYANADAVVRAGAGIRLDGGPAAVAELAGPVRRLLGEPDFVAGAAAVARDIAGLPSPASAVDVIEREARGA